MLLSQTANVSLELVISHLLESLDLVLKPAVSIATIVGIFIALFQFNRAIKNREEDIENARFNNTKSVFKFFIRDVIPLTHTIESNMFSYVVNSLEEQGFRSIDSVPKRTLNQLILAGQEKANIDEVFNQLEYQAWIIFSGQIDESQLQDMFSKSVVVYCQINAEAFRTCQKSRTYTNLNKLLEKWG
ncbi:hypothetical protein [Lactiplantibacillus pentosus]|uniref:hypothetical protein n=1 Tax=Lactiplantibacillus pentosus TaxID=1589 RepID=UPI002181FB2D|nr:hypothetical protein [Lactiplantibacillus pentosus]MCT0160983.1 hypothetical protein [Lactiplantibacillus pentosus]